MNILRKSAVVIVALGSVSTAQADLISVNDAAFGDDSVTFDTDTDLEWLDVKETMGLSYNNVYGELGAGGQFEGWRYATSLEVTSLWNAAGGDESKYTIGGNTQNNGLTRAVGAYTGFTRLDSDYVGAREIFARMADSPEPGVHYASLLWDTGNGNGDYTNLFWAPLQDSGADTPVASWLVRDAIDVPEPGTLALLGLGLAGMGFAKRKKA